VNKAGFVTGGNPVTAEAIMGRPTKRKDGQKMTGAERQTRYRERLRKTINRRARKAYQQKQGNHAATAARRAASHNAPVIPDGMDYRIGDCREMFKDIADASVPLILTDPPYAKAADPLYAWLAEFAARVLTPNGSLICFVGQTRAYHTMQLFEPCLGEPFWLLCQPHDQNQKFMGKLVYAKWKPVLWYVRGSQRRPDLRTFIADMLTSKRGGKELHPWAQGDGGVAPLIELLTKPGERVIEPFCGTASFSRIAQSLGRRATCCDLAMGGTTTVAA
jgi:site-specific DNA-methyltransferase (adenine-specific)